MKSTLTSRARENYALYTTGLTFWLELVPMARSELRYWRTRAALIPDPTLRRLAQYKLGEESLNPEAAAFFAVLAPRRVRRRLVRLIIAFQLAYDYLDGVNEEARFNGLQHGLRMHCALLDAVKPRAQTGDYYDLDDGAYLSSLVNDCQEVLGPLTAGAERVLAAAAVRCGEAQARNHALPVQGTQQLREWSEAQHSPGAYRWWELAAGGISCLSIHALFAAAMSGADLGRTDLAYFPSVCAISALLDSLVDYSHDEMTANHSFVAHYESSEEGGTRFAAIVAEALEGLGALERSSRHRVVLTGILSFYLSAPEAAASFATPIAASTLGASGPTVRTMLRVMALRRRMHQRH